MIYWLVGMSGAGKSVIGRALHRRLQEQNPATVLVDGDEIREVFRHDRGPDAYTVEGRRQNAERIRELCAWLDRQGIDVVACVLSIFEETHRWNRETYSSYFEVFVDAPFDVLVERNPKDLYRRAERGEVGDVVGVQIPFTPPASPDLVIHNGDPMVDVDEAVERILLASGAVAPVYSYASGELLDERNSYTYTAYEGPRFVDGWREARSAVADSLAAATVDRTVPTTPADEEFHEWLRDLHSGTVPTRLDAIVRHFEVTKRIFEEYGENDRPVDREAYRQLQPYVTWAEALVEAYALTGTLTYLNALLKCTDTLCAYSDELDACEHGRLDQVLGRERSFVDALEERLAS